MFPIEYTELIGALLLFFTIAFCNAVGIEGGGFAVTIGITLFMFSPKEAAAISNVIIFFACLTRFIWNFNTKHPLKDAVAVNYNIVACQLPSALLGTLVGVHVYVILPEIIVFMLLFIVLSYMTYTAAMTAFQTSKKETELREKGIKQVITSMNKTVDDDSANGSIDTNGHDVIYKSKDHSNGKQGLSEPLTEKNNMTGGKVNSSRSGMSSTPSNNSRMTLAKGELITDESIDIDIDDRIALIGEKRCNYKDIDVDPVLKNLLNSERRHLRLRNIFFTLVPILSIILIEFLRGKLTLLIHIGSESLDSIAGVNRCEAGDYLLIAAQVVILFILGATNIFILQREYNIKVEHNYQFVKGDVVWNFTLIIVGFFVGLISSSVGLSGGLLATPLLLSDGLPPTVATSTSMFMAMIATLSSSILYMFGGYVIYPFAFWLSAVAILGTLSGIVIVGTAIKRTGRASLLMWFLAALMLVSIVAEVVFGVRGAIRKCFKSKFV